MLRRLFIVLQSFSLIVIILFWILCLTRLETLSYGYFWVHQFLPSLVVSHIPYLFNFLGKYIVYGKFQLFKIG